MRKISVRVHADGRWDCKGHHNGARFWRTTHLGEALSLDSAVKALRDHILRHHIEGLLP